jgi:hypothetical protein
MTTPKKASKYSTAELRAVEARAELERRGETGRPPAPAKARQEAKPPERAAPAPPPKPVAPAEVAPTPPLGLEQPAAEVCSRFPLGEPARPLLQDGQKTRAFLQALVNAKQFVDAIKVLAHAVGSDLASVQPADVVAHAGGRGRARPGSRRRPAHRALRRICRQTCETLHEPGAEGRPG